jgi:AraC-like DNA-binding protein
LKKIVHSNQGEQSLEEIDDEFDLIETHLEQLLNKNNQLEQRVQYFVPQLKQLFMIRLIQGKVKEDEISAKLRSLQYKKEWTWLTIFSLKIDFTEMGDKKFNKMDQELILFAINNLMEDIISPHERFTPIVMNDTQSTILLTDHLNEAEYTRFINQKAEFIQKKVNELFQLTISIGISRRYKYLHETKKAYRESDEALKYRLKMGPGSIIFYDNLNREPINLVPFPAAINHQILDAIKMTDKEKAIKLVIDFFRYIDQNDVYDFQFDVILSRFLYDLFELKELLGVQIEHFDSTREITHYQHLSSLKEIRDWVLYDITLPLIEELKYKNDNKDRKVSDTIMRMIRENYNKEIYLDAIAAELHYNAKYLSSIFQKETGYTFSEYLLHYRLEKAKEWLITTCKPVKHIAEELKYNNPQNFIRSFKKMEGVTPGRYRAIYRKETKENNTANT